MIELSCSRVGVPTFNALGALPCHDTCMGPVVHLTGQQQGVAPETPLHSRL